MQDNNLDQDRRRNDRSKRRPWQAPALTVVTQVTETSGNGGAGFDFASEASA